MKPGLYEQVINEELNEALSKIPEDCQQSAPIDEAEASKVLAKYTTDIIKEGLDNLLDRGGSIKDQIYLANRIITLIRQATDEEAYSDKKVNVRGEHLLAVLDKNDPLITLSKNVSNMLRPETSMSESSIFMGAIHEPQMFSELKKEIATADRIDMLVAFIKWSGLRLIIDELRVFVQRGGMLRVITTSYMGATDIKAVDELSGLINTNVRISYDTNRTRLHAKAYIFYRDTGFTTAYIGSSNLSNAAMSSGLEWNVKATKQDLPDTIKKVEATFNSYWNSS